MKEKTIQTLEQKVVELIEKAESMGESGFAYIQKNFPGLVDGYISYRILAEVGFIVLLTVLFAVSVWVTRVGWTKLMDGRKAGTVDKDDVGMICVPGGIATILGFVWVFGSYFAIKAIMHAYFSPMTFLYFQFTKKGGCG